MFICLPKIFAAAVRAMLFVSLVIFATASASGSAGKVGNGALSAIEQYYGLDRAGALERLEAEAHATRVYKSLEQFIGEAYSGAWFDGDRLELVVAISDPRYEDWVKVAGAHPVLVDRSLIELTAITHRINRQAKGAAWHGAVTGWYIDYPTNSVVVEVLPGGFEYARSVIREAGLDLAAIRFEPSRGRAQLLFDLRGAEEFQNIDEGRICSVGASVIGGFVTAGHCGWSNHEVVGFNGSALGNFAGSTYPPDPYPETNRDRAWVSASSNWTPLPEINGYDDGILAVNGSSESPVNSTVCRYGRTTQGPHCGQIVSKGNTQDFSDFDFGTVKITGLTKTNVCAEGGDSGGPFVWVSNNQRHVQGTLTGGLGGCPGSGEMYFEPINGTLNQFNRTLLTTNGSNPPEITTWVCPNTADSGGGMFTCFVEYDSQGSTQVAWTGPGTPSGDTFFGSCTPGVWVTVSVTVSNEFGSDSRESSFTCPDGEIP